MPRVKLLVLQASQVRMWRSQNENYYLSVLRFTVRPDRSEISGNGKVYMVGPSSNLRPFFNGGIGVYVSSSGSTFFGVNVGGGVLYEITPKVGVQGSYNFHSVNTGPATHFSTVQAGVRFSF